MYRPAAPESRSSLISSGASPPLIPLFPVVASYPSHSPPIPLIPITHPPVPARPLVHHPPPTHSVIPRPFPPRLLQAALPSHAFPPPL